MDSESGVEKEPDPAILSDDASDPAALEGQWTGSDRGEAAHWVAVYQELIGVCRQLLDGDPLRDDGYDRTRLEARLRDFEKRQQFWVELLGRPEPPAE